ncbi:DUF6691 family protein [Agrilutibacter solisilvae]|uniref:YeeE/YedE family protein n=1 Tax=Agrilutibacter solisilvae TaxID=2763317 RepID=A0A974XY49_9GAMM|nr:DUF6691 family protein [Lysobacter solisilvae]QSX77073.1 YeeE/YedE family protein [Lysobacter solisilvae]
MRQLVIAATAGALFGVGLAVSRMTDPTVVLGFLDLAGAFDATLLFVFAGAVCVTVLAFRGILRRPRPVFAGSFQVPTYQAIDRPLLAGAALFGIGWGLAGYCPGPALVSLAAGIDSAIVFGVAMLAGIVLHRVTSGGRRARRVGSAREASR